MKLKIKRFKKFHESMNLSERLYTIEELKRLSKKYDINLVGSDQVWNLENGISNNNIYFLSFLPENFKKISYASSFGSDVVSDAFNDEIFQRLSSFKTILVREKNAVDYLKSCNLNSKQVLDPTFLPGMSFWSEIAGEKKLIKEKYIFAYGFGEVEETNRILKCLKIELNMPIIGTSVSIISPHNFDRFYNEAGPIEFLNLIKNAEYVITASYHGAAFAIHFRKSFLVIRHKTRNTRMESMLEVFGQTDRMIDSNADIIEKTKNNMLYIDYKKIENLIKHETEKSISYLNHAIIR